METPAETLEQYRARLSAMGLGDVALEMLENRLNLLHETCPHKTLTWRRRLHACAHEMNGREVRNQEPVPGAPQVPGRVRIRSLKNFL